MLFQGDYLHFGVFMVNSYVQTVKLIMPSMAGQQSNMNVSYDVQGESLATYVHGNSILC